MARPDAAHPQNVPGDWYADTRCIDCDVARHYAPGLIAADDDGLSVVIRQPSTPDDEAAMWRATLACPTRSIGTRSHVPTPDGVFPWALDDGVLLCGHNDRSSFGAHSYLLVREDGNLLVDSPSWSPSLARSIDALGGVRHVLLTHRDDVAAADRYASHFGARVWIHRDDASAAPYATDVVDGTEPVEVDAGVRLLPVPGHTRGSVVFHVDDRLLLTGDSLYLNPSRGHLDVFGGATWYSWEALTASMARLADRARFEWVLPGHGKWGRGDPDDLHDQLVSLAADMARHDRRSWDRRPTAL